MGSVDSGKALLDQMHGKPVKQRQLKAQPYFIVIIG